jgi:hypothetical protein
VGHELTHVLQFRDASSVNAAYLGVGAFLSPYLTEYFRARLGGMDHDAAYKGISFEKKARATAQEIQRFLQRNPAIATKLKTALFLNDEDLELIRMAFGKNRRLSLGDYYSRADPFAGTGFVSADGVRH